MVKNSKKKEKKLKKRLHEKAPPKQEDKKESKEKPKEDIKLKSTPIELLEKFSQPEHQDISKIMQEPAAEEAPLENIAQQFALPEEEEKIAGSKYTPSGEYTKEYKKYTSKELDAFATDKQAAFRPGPAKHSVEDEPKYTSKTKDKSSGY